MAFTWIIIVLLTVVVAAKSSIIMEAVEKLNGARNNQCARNNYRNDPDLFSELSGVRYNLYTSSPETFANNEVVEYDQLGNSSIHARSTNDDQCCKTLNITPGKEYGVYDITHDADCSEKMADDSGRMKLMALNEAADGSCCVIMWSCRQFRVGVHALCDKRKVSQQQTRWIRKQFGHMRLRTHKLKQTTDYSEGECFKN